MYSDIRCDAEFGYIAEGFPYSTPSQLPVFLSARQKSRKGGTKDMRLSRVITIALGTVAIITVIAGLVTQRTAHPFVATLMQVVHTLANPVPTVMADDPKVFVVSRTCTFGDAPEFVAATCGIEPLYTVPKGKTAVIDSVSGLCVTDFSTTVREFQMQYTGPDGTPAQLSFPPSPPVPFDNEFEVSITALNLTTYAFGGPTGQDIIFKGLASEPQTTTFFAKNCRFTLSGHFASHVSE
jgi:hypothetical protein